MPDEPTMANRSRSVTFAGESPRLFSIRSTSNLPHSSGRLSAKTPHKPCNVREEGTNIFGSTGREKGLMAKPLSSLSLIHI